MESWNEMTRPVWRSPILLHFSRTPPIFGFFLSCLCMFLLKQKIFQRKRLRVSTQIHWFNLENDQLKLSAKVNCSCEDFLCVPHTWRVCPVYKFFSNEPLVCQFLIRNNIGEKNTIFGFVQTTSRDSSSPKKVYESSNELFLIVNQYKPIYTCTYMRETACAHDLLRLCHRHTWGLVEKHTISSGKPCSLWKWLQKATPYLCQNPDFPADELYVSAKMCRRSTKPPTGVMESAASRWKKSQELARHSIPLSKKYLTMYY